MRAAVLGAGPQALASTEANTRSEDPMVVAAASTAHASLQHTLSLLDASSELSPTEVSPADVLGLDLLRVNGAMVDIATGTVTLPDEVADGEAAAALTRTWDAAVRMHVEAENFTAAHHLVNAAQHGQLSPDGGELSAQPSELVDRAENNSRTELEHLRLDLAAQLREARTNNEIDEEQDAELTAILRDSGREGVDPATARRALERIGRRLPDYRDRAARALRERLDAIAHSDHPISAEDVGRVNAFIDQGDLGTADELIYLLETNEELPSMRRHAHLTQFFPDVPTAVPDGITAAHVEIAREGGAVAACPVLDFGDISPELARLTADALDSWRKLGATPPSNRSSLNENDLLLPALRVAGLEVRSAVVAPDTRRHRDRKFVDVTGVTVNGKSMVPTFGSNAGDRRRVLLAWGKPSADTLLSWVDQDPSQDPIIVAYFGTMSPQVRRELAVRMPASHVPVIVLDDAALLYLAARGDRRHEATMRILLPFAQVNPYIRKKRGLVPREMFYGRKTEQRDVMDKAGTQIIYGGRGLGKSALLRDAEREFEASSPTGGRVALYLSLDELGIGTGKAIGPDAIFDSLLSELVKRDVIPKANSKLGRDAHSRVVAGITNWLSQDSSRRLLILLDESDRFFESDSPTFGETSRLRNLGTTTNDAAKVVFAGLHSVQRFAKVARNSPFSHLAQRPTVIGPLRPQSALDLLVEPMAAMGYEFAEPDLINRVLAKCSYQPFMLQMFGHRLVERMHKQRRELGATVPYQVTRTDIDSVESNEELREDITNAFRDTLNLDPRYNVIANVMARSAHESGLEARLSDADLLEECKDWWLPGFTAMDAASFRAYLTEMVGLGVLARNTDGLGWRLRGPAVLSMIGTASEVEGQLLLAATESLHDEFVALSRRADLGDGRTSPLTAAQIDDVLGNHATQARVVVGSQATLVGDVESAVLSAAAIGERFFIPPIPSRSAFESALTNGSPGDLRLVVCDLRDKSHDVGAASVRAAVDLTPHIAGVTRSVVLVCDTTQTSLWRDAIAERDHTPSLGIVALQRFTLESLRVWSGVQEKFRADGRTERLMNITGGWPYLVQMVADKVTTAGEVAAMNQVEVWLSTDDGGNDLLRRVGILDDDELTRAYADLVAFLEGESANEAGLLAAVGDATTDPGPVLECLRAVGVFSPLEGGEFVLEPVLARTWARLR